MYFHLCFSFFLFVSFLAIFQVYLVYVLYFTCFTVSYHIPGPTVFVSHFTCFSVFSSKSSRTVYIYHISCFSVSSNIPVPTVCVFLILNVFQGFLPYFISCQVSFSFSSFVGFLAIFQDLQCEFLIFLVGHISRHIPVPTVCISHLHVFQCFSPYSRSYIDCVSFSLFCSFLT